jgi:RNA polymerase sigma-B factor
MPTAVQVRTEGRAARTEGIVNHLRAVTTDDEASRRELTAQLIVANAGMARSIATRYRNRGIDLEDLQQVALLALTKAAQRFDPDAGHDFMSYAVPTIRGELRRHFRDAGWMVRPPRRVQELQARIAHAQDELESRLGRSPRPTEVAAHLRADLDEVVEALTADGCFAPTSLDAPVGPGSMSLVDHLGCDDRAVEAADARVLLEPLVGRLSERDRRVLHLRFVEERTQREIADEIGLTQAQVSRVLARILDDLKAGLGGRNPAA